METKIPRMLYKKLALPATYPWSMFEQNRIDITEGYKYIGIIADTWQVSFISYLRNARFFTLSVSRVGELSQAFDIDSVQIRGQVIPRKGLTTRLAASVVNFGCQNYMRQMQLLCYPHRLRDTICFHSDYGVPTAFLSEFGLDKRELPIRTAYSRLFGMVKEIINT
ncbi:MAG: hypothetical protein QY312_01460 [Candidatus Dojkabacteria bacterium]|nr:MAG: hypothetical protein QY312_01460 [Candidatus Dojkabacteria bacterium]